MAYSKNQHGEWLSLIEVSGPFLAEPILDQAFPQGLEKLDLIKKRQFRQTYDEWREVIDSDTQSDVDIKDKIHQQWIDWVLKFGLELDEDDDGDILKNQSQMSSSIHVHVTEHHVSLKPDYVIIASDAEKPYLLVQTYPPDTKLSDVLPGDGWSTSPAERMAHLCRGVGTRLGIITNGEQWMFIDAPIGGITTYASWYARLWGFEPVTLQAFYSLFNVGVVFNGFNEGKSLAALINESLQYQEDVTHTLGTQVSRAVEVLVQSIDRINHDHNGQLLEGVEPEELYEAGLTFMMRLVFLLCAEERGLLLLGDQAYEANYALSTLRAKLREEASLHGDEVLSYRKNAWSRLLAIFRAVYAGVEHENMRMPALGGSLFDPDRFPFLEGRGKGSNWQEEQAKPLPIDNRTVLLFLDAIQLYKGRTLSYRALDVEQIGYVYEGLLEQTVKRAPDVTLELSGSKSCKKPWVYLGEIASAELDGDAALQKLFKERTGSSASRITNDLKKEVTDADVDKLMVACYNDAELCRCIKPYYHFLRFDAWGNPLLYPKGAYMLTSGSDRRETGSHYTPKSLTESIVKETLEPVVYIGPTEGKPRKEWELKSPEALLDLKICDPAMGSGAFLVQVCRWLAERVCEAWIIAEQQSAHINVEGNVTFDNTEELIPKDTEERLLFARRLISERCLYGVDINPLAVELAKLSIWLITLSKGRPFGFLDHNFKFGDSLLGIHNLEQISSLNLSPLKSECSKLISQPYITKLEGLIAESAEVRRKLAHNEINIVSDIDEMAELERQAKDKVSRPKIIADAFIGSVLESGVNRHVTSKLSSLIQLALAGDEESIYALKNTALNGLSNGISKNKLTKRPFHWIFEFPEVFCFGNEGFDAIVGNPPFLGGRAMRGHFGASFLSYLQLIWPHSSLNADLCVFFFLRANSISKKDSQIGLLATKTIAQGDSARTGLLFLTEKKGVTIRSAIPSFVWPGTASVLASKVILTNGDWNGELYINSDKVEHISPVLDQNSGWGEAISIPQNKKINFQGSVLAGMGFVLNEEEAQFFFKSNIKNQEVIRPYLSGDDLNTNLNQKASRWAFDFRNWPLDYCDNNWPELMDRVRTLVKPKRDNAKRKAHKYYWWHHGDKRPALYEAIKEIDEVFAISRHTKYVAFIKVSTSQIFQESLCIIKLDNWCEFGFLQSTIHEIWVRRGSSTVGPTLRYTPRDYFDTFPFLGYFSDELEKLSESYYESRKSYMSKHRQGLTNFYNNFHDNSVRNDEINKIRALRSSIDYEVLRLYGLTGVNLSHSFYETAQGSRFSVADDIKSIILTHVLAENKKFLKKMEKE